MFGYTTVVFMIMKMLSSELFKEIYGNTHPPEGYCQEFHITHSSNSQFKTKLYSISRNSRISTFSN